MDYGLMHAEQLVQALQTGFKRHNHLVIYVGNREPG